MLRQPRDKASLELSNMRNPMKIITASPGLIYNYLIQLTMTKWPEEHPLQLIRVLSSPFSEVSALAPSNIILRISQVILNFKLKNGQNEWITSFSPNFLLLSISSVCGGAGLIAAWWPGIPGTRTFASEFITGVLTC